MFEASVAIKLSSESWNGAKYHGDRGSDSERGRKVEMKERIMKRHETTVKVIANHP